MIAPDDSGRALGLVGLRWAFLATTAIVAIASGIGGPLSLFALCALAASGLAVLVVTHEERVSRAAARVLRLEAGRLA